jgi:hypothetical protein
MANRHSQRDQQMRQRLAQEAARILLETGSRDFRLAKHKAATRFAATDTRNMPSNTEIEQAIVDYQRLFRSDSQPQLLSRLRQTALEAMRFFVSFNPLLVGPVLTGSADVNTPVTLHVFADSPEEISFHLMEQKVPFDIQDKRLKTGAQQYENFPAYRFVARDTPVEVIVLPPPRRAHAPLSPVDGRPMQRANMAALEKLLQADAPHSESLIGG